MNVLEHALQQEKEARIYYEKLAKEAPNAELRTIFTLLAEAEDSHYRALVAHRHQPGAARAESNLLEASRNIFQQLLAQPEDDALKVDVDGYLRAVKAEEESIRYYQRIADQEPNPAARELLLAIVEEERIHLNIIENIYEFVEAPRSYIECLEFIPRESL
ncbi:ferritin family protein [Geomesophilobacter sediminis]|uniref:Ferritin family protein n=1 Tax=Geomesophilobacter sediminis TaxID=2798584 RepID=A0A8J7J2I8_9BACT|nr:ferritin family protein [Geomesophilobacter sediminis]MBJ6724978.1 ferritin family protein [Geomesophilobacter sediminis]